MYGLASLQIYFAQVYVVWSAHVWSLSWSRMRWTHWKYIPLPLSDWRVLILPAYLSTRAFHSWEHWNTSSLCFKTYIQTYLVLSSMDVTKYSAPLSSLVPTFPHTPLWTTSSGFFALLVDCRKGNQWLFLWHMAHRKQTPHSHQCPNHLPFGSLPNP